MKNPHASALGEPKHLNMNTAQELKRGSYFVGIVWREDLMNPDNRKRERRDGFKQSVTRIPADKVSACFQVLGDGSSAIELMDVMARLPNGHAHQISCGGEAFWVAAVCDKRGTFRVLSWAERRPCFKQEDYD
jgi:hypothetical protein